MKAVKLSVRKVVEHVLRTGDIGGGHVDGAAMLEGARAHRRIQAAMGPEYQREVSLRMETVMGDIPVTLQGRADGVVLGDEGTLLVDEIKTTTQPLEEFYGQRELHMAQARCYAWMLLQSTQPAVKKIAVQLTYYHLETGELERFVFPQEPEELEAFFRGLMEDYGVWLRFERDWRERRDGSIRAMGFPYPAYRRGQRELAVAAYRAIEQGRRLYAQAPTGIGKTLSALFPAIKAVGEGKAEKLFYLTAKTVTRQVAEGAVRQMAQQGLRLKSVTLRAKEKICLSEEKICHPDHCPYAKGHYDRVNGALLDLLEHNDLITPEVVTEYARRHRVCPHETALDATLWSDLVIGDYNHVFDPVVYLKRFFADGGGDYVFLIDEAHNLGDRVREMYTAVLQKSKFYGLKKELKDKNKPAAALRKALGQVNAFLLEARKACGEDRKPRIVYEHLPEGEAKEGGEAAPEGDTKALCALLRLFAAAAEEWLARDRAGAHPLHSDVLELYFEALGFLGIGERYDERYVTITEVFGSEVAYTLYCLDPSRIIAEMLERGRSAILFSATMTPLGYYREMLGGREEDWILSLSSPFVQGNLLLAAHCGISTRYADREGSIVPIAEAIHLTISGKRGNYLVFFPSYEYLRRVAEAFARQYPQVEVLQQQAGMGEEARSAFLRRFDRDNYRTLVGFCVLGGIFSEGIDLAGDRLIGSVIVGVGLPGLSLRQDLIRAYFNRANGRGYDYAYVYPGMNKVLQAAGRVIRSEADRGAVLLIDSRFGTRQYRELYPPHWSHLRLVRSTREWEALTAEFYRAQPDG